MQNSGNNLQGKVDQKPSESTSELIARLTEQVNQKGFTKEALPSIAFIAEHKPGFFNNFNFDFDYMGNMKNQNNAFLRKMVREENGIKALLKARKKAIKKGKDPDTVFVINTEVINIAPLLSCIEMGGIQYVVATLDTMLFEFISVLSRSSDSQLDPTQADMIWQIKRLRDAFIYGSKSKMVLSRYDDENKKNMFTC